MTLSIVALDRPYAFLGVAVSSHWFNAGSTVPALLPGLGAVAVQAVLGADVALALGKHLQDGADAKGALAQTLATDSLADWRQIGLVDSAGNAAVHTGKSCIPCAAGLSGPDFAVQANMMLNDDVVPAMHEAYLNAVKSEEPSHIAFARRLLATLAAGQRAGGDIRGEQSAGVFVVSSSCIDTVRLIDLSVPDHKSPLGELSRLIDLQAAYDLMNLGDGEIARGDVDGAIKAYGLAVKMLPENLECRYWQAITLLNAGRQTEGDAIMEDIYAKPGHWRELTKRLLKCGLLSPP